MTNHYLGKIKSFFFSLLYTKHCQARFKSHKGFIVTWRINKLTGAKRIISQRYVMDSWKAAC
jgi:hypothetical protein